MTSSYIIQRLIRIIIIIAVVAVVRGIQQHNQNRRNGLDGRSTGGWDSNKSSGIGNGNSGVGNGGMGDSRCIPPWSGCNYGGVKTMKKQSGVSLWLLVIVSIMAFPISILLLVLMIDESWEVVVFLLLIEGFFLLLVVAAALFHYYMKKQAILFGEDGVAIYKPFKGNEFLPWEIFGYIEVQVEQCTLYDKNRQVRLKVTASWENYGLFCQMARRRLEELGGEVFWH